MDITILKKIGLSDKEIKVYLSLLEYGAISVRGLAEVTSLNRGTVYDILKKLQDSGLISFYHQDTKQKFIAEDPDKLLPLVRAREEELKTVKVKTAELIPELKSLQDTSGHKPVMKLYEGRQGVKYILADVLTVMADAADKEYYIYF